jgi:hypothetical protein
MLKIIGRNIEGRTVVQFTGKELKEWYSELGETAVYICHVVMRKVSEITNTPWVGVRVDSQEMIQSLRMAVPHRFRINSSPSCTVHRHMHQKYLSTASFSSYHTRKNLIRCVPDDFVFTVSIN